MNEEIKYLKEVREGLNELSTKVFSQIEKLRSVCSHVWGPSDYKWGREQQTCSECEKTRWREYYGYCPTIPVGIVNIPTMFPVKDKDGWYI